MRDADCSPGRPPLRPQLEPSHEELDKANSEGQRGRTGFLIAVKVSSSTKDPAPPRRFQGRSGRNQGRLREIPDTTRAGRLSPCTHGQASQPCRAALEMSVLELHEVSKVYGQGVTEVRAVENVSLSVEAGTLVAVMGASGSGKSTLLTIAGSLEEPTSGEVFVAGRALSKMSRADKARLRRRSIGYVFQDFNLLAGLTALENVTLPLELDGMTAKKAKTTRKRDSRTARPRRPKLALC